MDVGKGREQDAEALPAGMYLRRVAERPPPGRAVMQGVHRLSEKLLRLVRVCTVLGDRRAGKLAENRFAAVGRPMPYRVLFSG